MLPIVFGYPSSAMFHAAERGEFVLGGCVLEPGHPTHRCAACGEDVILEFNEPPDGRRDR
jgi:hypothetical protein